MGRTEQPFNHLFRAFHSQIHLIHMGKLLLSVRLTLQSTISAQKKLQKALNAYQQENRGVQDLERWTMITIYSQATLGLGKNVDFHIKNKDGSGDYLHYDTLGEAFNSILRMSEPPSGLSWRDLWTEMELALFRVFDYAIDRATIVSQELKVQKGEEVTRT